MRAGQSSVQQQSWSRPSTRIADEGGDPVPGLFPGLAAGGRWGPSGLESLAAAAEADFERRVALVLRAVQPVAILLVGSLVGATLLLPLVTLQELAVEVLW